MILPLIATELGAKGDGVHDDADAINSAIQRIIASESGGTLFFPPGRYRCSKNFVVTGGRSQISLVGNGWNATNGTGSWIVFDSLAAGSFEKNFDRFDGLRIANEGTRLENLGLTQPSNLESAATRTANRDFAAVSVANGNDTLIQNVNLLHVPIGFTNINGGRVSCRRVSGNPFQTGIEIQRGINGVTI